MGKGIVLAITAILAIIIPLNAFIINKAISKEDNLPAKSLELGNDNFQLTSKDFTNTITNKYLTYTPGTKYIYEGETEEGTEKTEVYVTDEIKKVMGVNTMVVEDKVYLNGKLIEDTKDWFAQDKYGNVWYFGEDSREIANGKIASTEGSWEAGKNGAMPGIVMKANPQPGEIYKQEDYPGEAEDMAEVIALGVSLKVKYGSFNNCLQTRDWNPLEADSDEYKYYCSEIGNLAYEVGIEDGEGAQLMGIKKDSKPARTEAPTELLKKGITEEEAKAIALGTVSGRVTDIEIEERYGKAVYAVEINDDGEEIDVFVDAQTGQVLGTDT